MEGAALMEGSGVLSGVQHCDSGWELRDWHSDGSGTAL